MTECEKIQDDLKAYMDGQLTPARRLAVRLHLARCASCREEIKTMEEIGNALHSGEEPENLEPALRARILDSIPEIAPQPPTPARPALWPPRPRVAWGAAAGVVLAWFVLYPVISRSGRSVEPPNHQGFMSNETRSDRSTGPRPSTARLAAPSQATGLPSGGPQDADSGGQSKSFAHVPHPAPALATRFAQTPATLYHLSPSGPADQKTAGAGAPDAATSTPTSEHTPETDAEATPTERQVHKEAEITVTVDKLEEKSEAVQQIATIAGGFVANNDLTTGDDGDKTASLTIKVPVPQFEAVMNKLAKLGDVTAKHISGEDLTEKISDEQERTHILRDDIAETQASLRQHHNHAQTREDMETLRELRIKIAQTQARLKLLEKLSTLSNITVDLQQKSKAPDAQQQGSNGGFMDELGDTAHAAVHSFIQAAKLPIMLLVWLLVYAPIWMLLALAYRYAVRR